MCCTRLLSASSNIGPRPMCVVLDYCLRRVTPEEKANEDGLTIQQKDSSKERGRQTTVTDTAFADDLPLLSNTLEHAQKLILTLEEQVEKVGLRVNTEKTQYMYELRPILYCYKAALEEVLPCDKLGVSGSRNKTVVMMTIIIISIIIEYISKQFLADSNFCNDNL